MSDPGMGTTAALCRYGVRRGRIMHDTPRRGQLSVIDQRGIAGVESEQCLLPAAAGPRGDCERVARALGAHSRVVRTTQRWVAELSGTRSSEGW